MTCSSAARSARENDPARPAPGVGGGWIRPVALPPEPMKDIAVSRSARTVEIVLGNKYCTYGQCFLWPKTKEASEATGLSTHQIERALKELDDKGRILRLKIESFRDWMKGDGKCVYGQKWPTAMHSPDDVTRVIVLLRRLPLPLRDPEGLYPLGLEERKEAPSTRGTADTPPAELRIPPPRNCGSPSYSNVSKGTEEKRTYVTHATSLDLGKIEEQADSPSRSQALESPQGDPEPIPAATPVPDLKDAAMSPTRVDGPDRKRLENRRKAIRRDRWEALDAAEREGRRAAKAVELGPVFGKRPAAVEKGVLEDFEAELAARGELPEIPAVAPPPPPPEPEPTEGERVVAAIRYLERPEVRLALPEDRVLAVETAAQFLADLLGDRKSIGTYINRLGWNAGVEIKRDSPPFAIQPVDASIAIDAIEHAFSVKKPLSLGALWTSYFDAYARSSRGEKPGPGSTAKFSRGPAEAIPPRLPDSTVSS
jgi:hypothetical protein